MSSLIFIFYQLIPAAPNNICPNSDTEYLELISCHHECHWKEFQLHSMVTGGLISEYKHNII